MNARQSRKAARRPPTADPSPSHPLPASETEGYRIPSQDFHNSTARAQAKRLKIPPARRGEAPSLSCISLILVSPTPRITNRSRHRRRHFIAALRPQPPALRACASRSRLLSYSRRRGAELASPDSAAASAPSPHLLKLNPEPRRCPAALRACSVSGGGRPLSRSAAGRWAGRTGAG
jgi:hypothetical protein